MLCPFGIWVPQPLTPPSSVKPLSQFPGFRTGKRPGVCSARPTVQMEQKENTRSVTHGSSGHGRAEGETRAWVSPASGTGESLATQTTLIVRLRHSFGMRRAPVVCQPPRRASGGRGCAEMRANSAEPRCRNGRRGAGQGAQFWMPVVTLETTASLKRVPFLKGPSWVHLSPCPASNRTPPQPPPPFLG